MNIIFSKILIRNFIISLIISIAIFLLDGIPESKFYLTWAVVLLGTTALGT